MRLPVSNIGVNATLRDARCQTTLRPTRFREVCRECTTVGMIMSECRGKLSWWFPDSGETAPCQLFQEEPSVSAPENNAQQPQLTDEEIAYVNSLFDAAREGRYDFLREALQAGVPANLTNGKGDTLLNLAAYQEQEETVFMLLEFGADTERVSDVGFTALICAVFRGNEPITRRLLEAGAGQATGNQHAQDVAKVFGQEHLLPVLQEFEPRGS